MKKILVAALFVCGTAIASNAQSTPVVDKRQDIQKERIKDGVKSGELNKAETKRLVKNQKHIKHAETKAKSDGTVTPAERAKLDKKQDKASKRIAKQKHDKQDKNE